MTSPFDDEVLVAYLDGELDAEQTQKIDQQIATHDDLRNRINQLRMTWDMLDELPVKPPSPSFAETTLEMAAMSSTEEPKTALNWLRNNVNRIVILSIPLLFLSGFIYSRISQRLGERQLLLDLPILVDWRALSDIDSQEWLDVLVDQPDLVKAFNATELGLVGHGDVPFQLNERRDWVSKLDDAERGRLSNNLAEFRRRDPDRQSGLRKIIGKIYSDPSTKEKYLAAVRCYELLLQKQSMTQHSSLYDLPLAERKSELLHLISVHRSQQFAKDIPSSDAAAIREWAEDMRNTYLIVHGNNDALRDVNMDLYANPACEINLQDFENLASRMSPEAQNILHGLNSTESYADTIVYWIRATIPNETSGDRIGAEKVKETYMKLSGTQQEQVDLLPPDQAKSLLRKLAKPRTVHQPNDP